MRLLIERRYENKVSGVIVDHQRWGLAPGPVAVTIDTEYRYVDAHILRETVSRWWASKDDRATMILAALAEAEGR